MYLLIYLTKTTLLQYIILGIRIRSFASRRCTDYARVSYAVAGEACVACVTFAVEAVWC